jgi:hypothetical protein
MEPLNYFSLVRHGVLNLKGLPDSQVQCAGIKHHVYKYGVGVLYAGGLALDNKGWLIDNNAIDAALQNTGADSCERMLISMKNDILKLLQETGLPFVGIKILLRPVIVTDEKVAEFCIYTVVDKSFRSEIIALKVEAT